MGRPQKGTEARAEALFWVYYGLGSERSLKAVSKLVRDLGVTVSAKTLERYSARFQWQQHMGEVDAKVRARQEEGRIEDALGMNIAQVHLGRSMRLRAQGGLDAMGDEAELSPQDIARLGRDGTHIERLAMGEATDRHEILVTVYNQVLQRIQALFLEINENPDAGQRRAIFALKVDEIGSGLLGTNPAG